MRVLLLLAVIILAMIVVPSMLRSWRPKPVARPTQRDELVKDPVCQTYILLSRSVTTDVDGIVTHFCSRECAARYARGERSA